MKNPSQEETPLLNGEKSPIPAHNFESVELLPSKTSKFVSYGHKLLKTGTTVGISGATIQSAFAASEAANTSGTIVGSITTSSIISALGFAMPLAVASMLAESIGDIAEAITSKEKSSQFLIAEGIFRTGNLSVIFLMLLKIGALASSPPFLLPVLFGLVVTSLIGKEKVKLEIVQGEKLSLEDKLKVQKKNIEKEEKHLLQLKDEMKELITKKEEDLSLSPTLISKEEKQLSLPSSISIADYTNDLNINPGHKIKSKHDEISQQVQKINQLKIQKEIITRKIHILNKEEQHIKTSIKSLKYGGGASVVLLLTAAIITIVAPQAAIAAAILTAIGIGIFFALNRYMAYKEKENKKEKEKEAQNGEKNVGILAEQIKAAPLYSI